MLDENGEQFVEYIVTRKWTPFETLKSIAQGLEQWAKEREERGEPLPLSDEEEQVKVKEQERAIVAEQEVERKRKRKAEKRENYLATLDPTARRIREIEFVKADIAFAKTKAKFDALTPEEQAQIREVRNAKARVVSKKKREKERDQRNQK